MGKKQTTGSDPFAEFGGAAIMQEADPFAEFGGSAIEQQPPFPQAPTQQAPAPAGSAGAPVGASPSTSAHGTGAATAAPPVPTTYELPTPQEEAEIQRGYDAGLVSPEELRTQGFEARARGLEAQQGERERTRAADIFSSLDESGLAEYKKQMEERQAALKQESVKLQAQAASLEKAASQQLSQEEADFMRAEQKTLRERAYAIAAEARDLDTDKRLAAKRDYEIKSGQGSVWGATWNNLLGSVGGAVLGLNAPIASAMAEAMPAKPKEGETQDQANRRMVNSLRQAMRGAPKEMIGDSETTDEYIAEMQKGFLSGPWFAVTSTVPLAALGPAGTGMMLSAADNVMREVEDDPSFENIPEWKKYTVAYTIGAITGQLEKAGFRGAVTGSGVVKRILNKAIDRMPAGATEAQVRAILNQETKSAIANMSGRLASSMAEEAFTEGVQAGVEPAMKDIFNAIEEKNLMPRADGSKGFETPNGFSGYVTDMFENAKVGALGGAIMGTPVAVWKMTKEASLGKNTNDAQFQAISDMLNDPDMQDVLMNDIRDQVASGTMSAAKAREIEASWKQAKSILYRIPKGLSQEARREAYDLLAKKDELSLVDKSMASGEVEAIDQQLAELVKKDAIARAEADRVVTTLPPSLENVSLSQEENDRIAAARAELGIEFDALEGLTDGMVMTFNRVENDLPTSPSAIDEVSGFLYAKYKELQAMKQAPKGVLTIDQIDSLMEQLGSDIELLETYKQKQREQAEGITGAQTQSQGSANAGTDTQAAQEGGSDGRQRQVVAQPAIQEPASKVEKPAQEVPAAQPKVEPVAAQERAQDPIGGLAPEAITELDDVLGVAETPPAVSPEGPVRPDGPTPQAMRKQGSDGRRTPGISADNVRKALAQEAPDIKIVTHTRLEDYRAAIDAYNKANNTKADPSASVAVYLPGTNEIHLSPSADGRSLAHEAAHPIVSALIERKPELFDRLYEEVLADPAAKEAVDFGKLYSDADQTTVKAETLVRFMDAVASGKIKVSTDPKSAWQRFKAWLSDILARIGFGPKDIDLSNPANVREFAAMFSKAVNEGIEIRKIRGERGGVNAGPMMQRDEAFNGIEQPKTPIGDTKTVMVDGKERTVFNSEGRPIHPTVEGVRNFWRWFGDSKVVDEQGRPLVVYHGTSEKFDTFKKGTIHLSDNERVAYSYARGYLGTGVGDVMSVYVRIQKPADVRSVSGIRKVADKAGVLLDDDRIHDPESLYEDADTLSSEGYDGIIANHQMSLGINDGTSEYIVFDSELVKSATGNYGTFDPSRANINEQRRSPSEVAATFAKHGLSPEQAAAYMRQRGVSDDFAQQVVAEMRPKEEAKTPPPEPKKPERRKRATTQKLVEAFPSLGPALTENMVFYDRLPNDVTQAAAEALIDEHGVDGAAAAVLDQTSPMSPPVRMLLGGIVMDRLHKAGEIDKLIEFGDKFLTSPTEYGQAIQILNALYRNYWSPEVAVRKSVRDIQRDRSKKYKRHKKTIDKLKKGLKDINAKAAESVMASAVKQGMKALDQKIADIIRKHYTEYDAKRRALQDRLVSEAGLDGKEAQELADAVGREFDRIATEAKRKLMRSVLPKAATNKTKRKNKAIEDELVALTNAGAFSDDDFIKAYGDKMGWPKLTRENIAEIERLAERIQTVPEGRPRNEAIQDLLGYQMSIPGIDLSEIVQSVWYANMLSGHETQEANVLANLYNFTTQAFIAIGQATTNEDARRAIPGLFRAIIDGVNSGRLEFRAVWSTGYNPIRGQIEAPSTAERKKFTPLKVGPIDVNPLNKVKYVRRFMVAVDSIYYEAARSMRAYQMAVKMASDEKKLNPSLDVRNRAAEIIGKTNDAIQQAVEQADSEYAAEVEAIRSGSMPEAQRKKLLQKAARDRRRRVFELTEKKRPEPLVVASADFAKRLTYNHKPEGVLGFMAGLVNLLGQRYPGFRYVVPFTNVIANVANETVNYTPLGYIKAYHEGGVFTKREEWTDDQRRDMMWKATMGTMMMVAMYMLSHPEDEDDEPWVQVTANGFGDYRRNEVLRETGWRPYSIRFGDGPWISYKYTPLILALGFIGNANDFVKYRKKKLTDTRLTKWSSALGWTTLAFLDQTYLSSLNNLLSAMMDPRNEDRADDVARTALRTAKTAVIPNLYTQGSKAVMDWAEMPEKEIRGTTLGFLLKDVPVFRGMYQDAVNVLGDPLVPQAGRFISLSDNSDEVANFLADRGIGLSAPHPNTLLYDTGDGDRVFTPEMQHKFYVERGKYIKARILSRMDNLRGMEKEKAAEVVAKIAAKATNIAKKKATGLAPD